MQLAKTVAGICGILLLFFAGQGRAADTGACPPDPEPLTPELFQAARAQAQDRGPLWRVSKDGHSSYLYGTLHVGKAQWMAPGPLLAAALRQTDMMGLELDPLDESMAREMAAGLARRAPGEIPASLHERLRKLWTAACLPGATLGQGPVQMQLFTLMFMVGRREGLHAAYGSELMLAMLGRSAGLPVVSLESASLQLDALLGGDGDVDEAQVIDAGLEGLETDQTRLALLKSVQVWERADMAELARYPEWCDCMKTEADRKLMKRLLDDRNPDLARRIAAHHSQGRKLFAAVGTLHMAGPQGIPALLAGMGYRVERLR